VKSWSREKGVLDVSIEMSLEAMEKIESLDSMYNSKSNYEGYNGRFRPSQKWTTS